MELGDHEGLLPPLREVDLQVLAVEALDLVGVAAWGGAYTRCCMRAASTSGASWSEVSLGFSCASFLRRMSDSPASSMLMTSTFLA